MHERFRIFCTKCGLLETVPNKIIAILQAQFYVRHHNMGDECVCIHDSKARTNQPNLWLVTEDEIKTIGHNRVSIRTDEND
jgi:hypothetical protein